MYSFVTNPSLTVYLKLTGMRMLRGLPVFPFREKWRYRVLTISHVRTVLAPDSLSPIISIVRGWFVCLFVNVGWRLAVGHTPTPGFFN